MPRAAQKYAAVSLFSGCGGMDLGAEQTGRVGVVWAVDSEHWAVETYRRSLGRHIVEADITQTEIPDVAPDDFDAAAHQGAAVAISVEDRDAVLCRAHKHWTSERDGDDITATEPVTIEMFRAAG